MAVRTHRFTRPLDTPQELKALEYEMDNIYRNINQNNIEEGSGLIIGYAVDETDTDATKNKMVSNNLAKGWEDHKNLGHASDPHGIDQVDETDTDATKNKMVSNNLAKGWEDHKNETLADDTHNIVSALLFYENNLLSYENEVLYG